jgi:hypothetical protein
VRKEHDITKLPKWAQREISRLTRDLVANKAKLAQGPENSNVFADPYSDAPRPLGRDTSISFRLTDEDRRSNRVIVRMDGDKLVIQGGDSLSILPRASNSFYVRIAHRT